MRIGLSMFAQNYTGWENFDRTVESGEWVAPPIPDSQIIQDEISYGMLAEELGFDTLWTVEHHFSPYTMVTNPMQWLSYFAGRTERIGVGSMVVVLPWHNPVRVAEDIVMLDNVLGPDRELRVGFGRGAGRREFAGLGIDMNESRGRFDESVEIIKGLIANDVFSYEGEYFQLPKMSTRPRPRDAAKILENLRGVWGSVSSIPVIAKTGLKPMIIPQRPWDDYLGENREFAVARAEAGYAPANPIVAVSLYCAETEEKARIGAEQYFVEYADSAVRNYELYSDHFKDIKGYEGYATEASKIPSHQEMSAATGKMWVDNHVWGTPEMIIKKLDSLRANFATEEIICLAKVGSMSAEVADASMRLFAKEVLPEVHDMPIPAPIH